MDNDQLTPNSNLNSSNPPTPPVNNAPPGGPVSPPTPPLTPPPSQPPSPPGPPANPSSPPPTSPPPTSPQNQPPVGVGTPNIGVEKNLKEEIHKEEPVNSIEKKENDFSLVDPPKTDKPEQAADEKSPHPPQEEKEETKPEIPPLNQDLSGNSTPTANPNDPDTNRIEVELTAPTPIKVKHYNEKEAPPQTIPVPPKQTPPTFNPPTATTPPQGPTPPVKAPIRTSATLTAMTIAALILGSLGGFFGYRYIDKAKIFATSETTPTPTQTATANQTASLDTSLWPIYTSNLYDFTLKYPNGWFSNTTDPQAESLAFASDKESLNGTSLGYKIDLTFQDKQGKTLKDWVDSNAVVIAEPKKPKEITVSDQTAYQQEVTKNGPQIVTYIDRGDKVMVVTYSAPIDQFGQGGDFYNNLINSIKLM